MILDHIGLNVSDLAASKRFYEAALAPLGIGVAAEGDGWAMLGRDGKPQFWFGAFGASPGPIHIAFAAAKREQVRQFYAAALQAGGKDNGARNAYLQVMTRNTPAVRLYTSLGFTEQYRYWYLQKQL